MSPLILEPQAKNVPPDKYLRIKMGNEVFLTTKKPNSIEGMPPKFVLATCWRLEGKNFRYYPEGVVIIAPQKVVMTSHSFTEGTEWIKVPPEGTPTPVPVLDTDIIGDATSVNN